MATDDQPAEQVTELLQNLKVDSQTNAGDTPEGTPNLEGDALHSGTEASAPSGFPDVVAGAYEGYFDTGVYYAANYYTVPHGYYYGGYEYPIGDWEDYSQHIGIDSSEVQTLANDIYGVYDENGTLLYHAGGYGYTQPIYGPYTSGAPILANGQLYSPSYPYPAHIYQQPMASSAQLTSSVSSDVPISTIESANQGISGMNGALVNGNNAPLGQRAHYPATILPSVGPYRPTMLPSTGSLPVSQDGNSGTAWKNGSKVTDGREGHAMSEPLSVTGPPGQTLYSGTQTATHTPAGQSRFPSTAAPLLGAYSRFYHSPARAYSGFIPGRGQGLRFNGVDSRGNGSAWTFDKGRARGRAPGPICNGNENLDVLNEQNRGPRTSRIRNQQTLPGASRLLCQEGGVNGNSHGLGDLVSREQYNRSDFSTNYENAKFFIIKSYSEDDIHKSIKYNVWASTPNGNKKLDAAYKEAQENAGHCPVFLFFSVNASGQFCGVAEMVGAVDFSKNMDFWQQDKWNGRFPVKWHIIKDVPNNQFRHIILANNDNKPVTNSRDTQEVNFQQGIEMLNLFKNYIFKTSILDDFQFYENRQRAMQEKRARQQLHTQPQLMMPPGCLDNTDLHNGTPSNLADENRQSEGDGNTSQLGSTSTVTLSGTSPMESSSLLITVQKESLARAGVQSENGNSSNGSKNSDE